MLGFYFDPMYFVVVGPAILFALYAQMKVKSAFNQYSRMPNSRGLSGAEAAADMLAREGLSDVRIEQTQGWLSDHYDPSDRCLRLSPDVYQGRSVAAVGVACHEAGHALQHAQGYAFLGLRSTLVPVASIGSWLAWPLIFLGLIINSLHGLAWVGVILFGAVVLFQIITLPVEFDASARAKDAIVNNTVLTRQDEIEGVRKVLGAAALTYVAATLTALAQMLYFLMILTRRD